MAGGSARSPAAVVIVDDDPDILESYAALLQARIPGIRTLQAGSGPEALGLVRKEPVGLLIVDFRLPGMNGLEFLREVAAIRPGVPSIVVTAYPDMDIAIEALNEARIKHYLTKPVTADRLVGAVLEAMRS